MGCVSCKDDFVVPSSEIKESWPGEGTKLAPITLLYPAHDFLDLREVLLQWG